MRFGLFCAALLLASCIGVHAEPVIAYRSLGYQQMTTLTAAAVLPSIPAGAEEAFIVCTGQTVYWRDDGIAPTATVGMPLTVNQPFPYTGSLPRMQIIQTAPTAVCNVTYYGQ